MNQILKFSSKKIGLLFLVLCVFFKSHARVYDSFWNLLYENFDLLPEYHMDADIGMFFLHRNAYFKEKYHLESNTDFDLVFFSFRDVVFSVWKFELQTGMGKKKAGNVVFDPMDINFGIVPSFEIRTTQFFYDFGLNHHCFHEIDRKEQSTVYWNKLFLGIGSPTMRMFDFWSLLTVDSAWTYTNRISWYVSWGYYLRKFFDIIRPSTINGQNLFLHDATADLKYALYRRNSWIFVLHGQSKIGYWKSLPNQIEDSGAYWRLDFGIESNFRRGKKGAMIYVNYTLDHLPTYHNTRRFSKDRLMQIGFRFYN